MIQHHPLLLAMYGLCLDVSSIFRWCSSSIVGWRSAAPTGLDQFCYGNPGFRGGALILGYSRSSLSGLARQARENGLPARETTRDHPILHEGYLCNALR